MAVGEQTLSIFRLTMEQPSTEEGVVCEYRYELPYLGASNDYSSANGKVNQCAYVRYRPAAEEGGQDEMLLEVVRCRSEYTVTFYETGAEPVSETYHEKSESAEGGQILVGVEDPSTIEGLPLSLAEVDFLPELPQEPLTLERSDEACVVRGVPALPGDEVAFCVAYNDDTWNLLFMTALAEEKGAYALSPERMDRLRSEAENETGEKVVEITRCGASINEDMYTYDFNQGCWTSLIYVDVGENCYYAYISPERKQLSLNTQTGDMVWLAEYDTEGKLLDAFVPQK